MKNVINGAVAILDGYIKKWGKLVMDADNQDSLGERQRRLACLIINRQRIIERFKVNDNVVFIDFKNKRKVA